MRLKINESKHWLCRLPSQVEFPTVGRLGGNEGKHAQFLAVQESSEVKFTTQSSST